MKNKLKWCAKLKEGLKIIEPNERLSRSYLEKAKLSLERAEKNFKDKDFLWTTVVIYYAEYYVLYAFLQRIGVKCENHFCSILVVEYLLGNDKVEIIHRHKSKRIDAQYYIKIGKEKEIEQMLQKAKIFVSTFDKIISDITEKEIISYRNKLKLAIS